MRSDLMPMPMTKARANREQKAARRIDALNLRIAGFTYDEISKRLGLHSSTVANMLKGILSNPEQTSVRELRDVENARLDKAQSAIWTKVLRGDLHATDTYLRLSARRAAMNGLDAPKAINISTGVQVEMETALQELQNVVLGEVVSSSDEEVSGTETPGSSVTVTKQQPDSGPASGEDEDDERTA